MRRFLHSGRVGVPQLVAASVLLLYVAECLWLVRASARHPQGEDPARLIRIQAGLRQWRGGPVAGTPTSELPESQENSEAVHGGGRARDGFDQDRSPLYYLTASAAALLSPKPASMVDWQFLAAVPSLFFGLMLGGSLWYVARRLYGNVGGYIALTLYCSSPAFILSVAGPGNFGEMGAIWGAFGTIWTGIAVAHTLYAPREVVLWNWRRIMLLGLAISLAVGHQFSLAVLVTVALGLMLWAAPVRRGAVLVIWTAACLVAIVLLTACYRFDLRLFWHGVRHAAWLELRPGAALASVSYRRLLEELFRAGPTLLLLLPAALAVFVKYKRARYFGNVAPLGIGALLLVLGMADPAFPGEGFFLAAMTFLFVFVAGVAADFLETDARPWATAVVAGLLIAGACWNIQQLARAG